MTKKEIENPFGPRKIDEYVRLYRALIVWHNRKTGGERCFAWLGRQHNALTLWDSLYKEVEKAGYAIDYESNSDLIFDVDKGKFRDIVIQYRKDKDLAKLNRAIEIVMWHRPSFRIVSENTDEDLKQVIITKSNDYHYSNLMLYRRNSVYRIMSEWYDNQLANYDGDKKDFNPAELTGEQLDELITKEVSVREHNVQIWRWFSRFGSRYVSASYEDVFGASNGDSTIMHITFRWLFYSIWDFLSLKEKGESGNYKYYSKRTECKHLEKKLSSTYRPTFSNMHVEV